MTQVAGEVCDGFIAHGFTTEKYLREVTLPNLAIGREKAGKSLEGFSISGPFFVVTGQNEEEMQFAESATRQQLRFMDQLLHIRVFWSYMAGKAFKMNLTSFQSKVNGLRWERL